MVHVTSVTMFIRFNLKCKVQGCMVHGAWAALQDNEISRVTDSRF